MKGRRSLRAYAEACVALLAEAPRAQHGDILRVFVKILARDRVLRRAEWILRDIERLLIEQEGSLRADIYLPAVTMKDRMPVIEKLLSELVGRPVRGVLHERPSLIAGFCAQVEDLSVDASLQGTLSRLRSSLGAV